MSINALLQSDGVVWHECDACGRTWPFPLGVSPDRDWQCAVCVQALRAVAQREPLLKRYLDNHCANADAEGMSALCECKLCIDVRKAVFA